MSIRWDSIWSNIVGNSSGEYKYKQDDIYNKTADRLFEKFEDSLECFEEYEDQYDRFD
jgi:hypothetical protein